MRFYMKLAFRTLALGLVVVVSIHATTLMRMSLAQLANASQEIVRAKCIANSTTWDEGEIWTLTRFAVEETWQGSATGEITVRLLGGRAAQFTSRVSGVPRFHPGEEVILFLERTDRGDYSIVSWQQGTFRIQRVSDSGDEAVTQDTAGFETFDPFTHKFLATGIRRVPITDFRSAIQTSLANPARPAR